MMSLFEAQMNEHLPQLDLHGSATQNFLYELEPFLDRVVRTGESAARVIVGKGSGALYSSVKTWLKGQTQYRVEDANAPHEIGAVLYVFVNEKGRP